MPQDSRINVLVEELKNRFPALSALYIFGSQADGTANSTSDFDLAILLPNCEKIEPLALYNLKTDLEVLINADIDLIDLNACSTVMAFQIIMKGISILVQDQYYVDNFEVRTMSMYQRLQEERKGILEEIARTGNIVS